MSYMKTAMLMTAVTTLFLGVGYLIGEMGGAVIALALAAAMSGRSYRSPSSLSSAVTREHFCAAVLPDQKDIVGFPFALGTHAGRAVGHIWHCQADGVGALGQ